VLTLDKPITRVRYELAEASGPALRDLIEPIISMSRVPVGVAS